MLIKNKKSEANQMKLVVDQSTRPRSRSIRIPKPGFHFGDHEEEEEEEDENGLCENGEGCMQFDGQCKFSPGSPKVRGAVFPKDICTCKRGHNLK